jgi:hypothetical protein
MGARSSIEDGLMFIFSSYGHITVPVRVEDRLMPVLSMSGHPDGRPSMVEDGLMSILSPHGHLTVPERIPTPFTPAGDI